MRKSGIAGIGISAIMLVGLLSGCSTAATPGEDAQPVGTPVPSAPPATSVTLNVIGEGTIFEGTYNVVSKTGTQTAPLGESALPWTTTLDVAGGTGTNYALLLVNGGDEYEGDLTCEILFDGELVSTMTATGAGAFVTCNAQDY